MVTELLIIALLIAGAPRLDASAASAALRPVSLPSSKSGRSKPGKVERGNEQGLPFASRRSRTTGADARRPMSRAGAAGGGGALTRPEAGAPLVEAFLLADQPEHVTGATDHRCWDTARGLARIPGLRASCVQCLALCTKHRRAPMHCGAARHCALIHVKSVCPCAITRRFLAFNATSSRPIYQVHDVVDNFAALHTPGSAFDAKFVNTLDMLRDARAGVTARLPNGTVIPAPSWPPAGEERPGRAAPRKGTPGGFHVVPHYHINDLGIRGAPRREPALVTWVGYAPLEPGMRTRIEAMLSERHPGVKLRRHKFDSHDKAAAMRNLAASDAVLVWDQCYRTPRGAPSNPIWRYQCASWKPAGRLAYAMSLGVPVLAHQMYSANREAVQDGSAAEFSLVDDSSVVAKLDAVLGNFTLRQELSRASLETARQFQKSAVLRRYRRILVDKLPQASAAQRAALQHTALKEQL